jgi:hypothetical protein
LGFHFVEALREGRIFIVEYYNDNILTALIPRLPAPGNEKSVGKNATLKSIESGLVCRLFGTSTEIS